MKKIFLVGMLCLGVSIFNELKAQSGIDITFNHDQAGNRVKRWISPPTPPCPPPCDNNRHSAPFDSIVENEKPSEIIASLAINAFPNPTDRDVTIVIDNFENVKEDANFVLIDNEGKTLQQFRITNQKTIVDMSNCAAGTYYLNVIADGKKLNFTVIKRK